MKPRFTPILSVMLASLTLTNLAYAEDNALSATSPTAVLENSKTTAQTREQVSKIVFADDFSKKVQNKHWQRKHPLDFPDLKREKPTRANKNSAEIVGLIVKIMALMALLAGIVWVVKNADTWLAWFQGSKGRRRQSLPNADIASHYRQAFAPIWQGLPEKSQLTAFVKEAVAKGDWLLALSTLYRGTLREIVDIYDLPITRATTERQGEWLLQKQNAQPQETQFFQQLVEIWAKVAYGQQRPNHEQVSAFSQIINQLATTWDSLYLHRQSPLEKRYQQFEQSPHKAKPAKQAGGNT